MSVERSPNGKGWRARWHERGHQRSRTFGLKRDAEAFDREITRRRQLGPLTLQLAAGRPSDSTLILLDCSTHTPI